MKECPLSKVKINKSVFCPNRTCEDCIESKRIKHREYAELYLDGNIILPVSIPYKDNTIKLKSVEKISKDLREKIYKSLFEFNQAIMAERINLKDLNKRLNKQRREAIKHLEKAMLYPFIPNKNSILDAISKLKDVDQKKGVLHPQKNVALFSAYYKCYHGPNYLGRNIAEQLLLPEIIELSNNPLIVKGTKPVKDYYLKALIFAIYTLLHKQKKRLEITSKILEEYFKTPIKKTLINASINK